METKGRRRQPSIDLPTIAIHQPQSCEFEGTDALSLMTETARVRKLIIKLGTLEDLYTLFQTSLIITVLHVTYKCILTHKII